jgi:hypothetical protein
VRTTAIVLALFAVILWTRSAYVWGECGYDCGILPGAPAGQGLAAIVGVYLAYALLIVAASFAVAEIIRKRRGRGAGR